MAGPVVAPEPDEAEKVYRWRYHTFRRLGLSRIDAELLAVSDADLHRAVELVEQKNCPLELVGRILT